MQRYSTERSQRRTQSQFLEYAKLGFKTLTTEFLLVSWLQSPKFDQDLIGKVIAIVICCIATLITLCILLDFCLRQTDLQGRVLVSHS